MQILITDSSLLRTRVLHFKRWQLALIGLSLTGLMMLTSGALYHFIFLTAAREDWPVMGPLVKLISRDETAQRERYMRENLDAMALRVGELQAKLVKLEALSERVTGLAGVKTDDLRALPVRSRGGQGGPFVPLSQPTLEQINEAIDHLDERADIGSDLFTLVESSLFETRLQALLVPSTHPVQGPVGSGFGFRIDPFTGRAALHTGLDFPSDPGTPILAAAGGMVVVSQTHPAYGQLIEIDHGNSLMTRYAHASKLLVNVGAMVKRGQKIAEVGNTGRSTGPHLHFEVLVSGVQQNPSRFLAGKVASPTLVAEANLTKTKLRGSRRQAQDVGRSEAAAPAGTPVDVGGKTEAVLAVGLPASPANIRTSSQPESPPTPVAPNSAQP